MNDPFREEKTPAHDVLQLYFKENANLLIESYLSKYYPDALSHKREWVTVRELHSEVALHLKKSIVVDALVTLSFPYRPYDYMAHGEHYYDIIVELKTKIFSFGDVLRQIHEYPAIVGSYYKPLLVTTDERFDKYFESENVAIMHPDKDALVRFAEDHDIPIKEYAFSSAPNSKPSTDKEKKLENQSRLEFER